MIPDECKMPDLSDLDFPLKRYLLIHVLVGNQGLSRKEELYRRNFVRLVDKAIKEYREARNTIIFQIEEAKRPVEEMTREGRIIYIFGFTDHFENCINALSRLLKQLDSIKSESGRWKVTRQVRRSIEAHARSIPNIRNSAEHMAERIQKDELQERQPVMLSIGGNGDKAVLSEYEIKFDEVASAIRGLHKVALDLLDVKSSNQYQCIDK